LPTAYHEAAEFNASVQMTGQYCPSVVEITQLMKEPEEGKEVPIDQQGKSELHNDDIDIVDDCQPGRSTDIEESIMPLRLEKNRALELARCKKRTLQGMKSLTSSIHELPLEELKEYTLRISELAEEMLTKALKRSAEGDILPISSRRRISGDLPKRGNSEKS